MKRLLRTLPVLVLAAAWFARDALRAPVSAEVRPPRSASANAAVVEIEPLDAVEATPANPRTLVDAPRSHAGTDRDALHRRVRGVLRDLRTNKPIPEVRVAVERGSELEVLKTDQGGAFVSARAYAPGPLVIDPTPFADDDEDWYSAAVGERVEVSLAGDADEMFEVVVDAPAFVVLDGAPRDARTGLLRRPYLVLPGAEVPGRDGSTHVPFGTRRDARYVTELSDGALLFVPEPFPDDARLHAMRGSGPARLEVAGHKWDPRWYATGPLHLAHGRILDERVPVRERSDCGALFVEAQDPDGERIPVEQIAVTLRALSPLPRPALPATRRAHADWTLRFDVEAGEEVRPELGQLIFGWCTGPLPVASYEVEVQHPRYEIARQVVQVERGRTSLVRFELTPSAIGPALRLSATWRALDAPCPRVKWKLTRLAADGTPYRRGYISSRLDRNTGGHLTVEHPRAELEGLPAAQYAAHLYATSVGDAACFPIRITPQDAVLDAEAPLEVIVENAALRRWRVELAPEHRGESWTRGTKQFELELFATDGASLGTLTCWLEEGVVSLYAPVDDVARYEFVERGVASTGHVFRGAWRADREQRHGSERERVLVLH